MPPRSLQSFALGASGGSAPQGASQSCRTACPKSEAGVLRNSARNTRSRLTFRREPTRTLATKPLHRAQRRSRRARPDRVGTPNIAFVAKVRAGPIRAKMTALRRRSGHTRSLDQPLAENARSRPPPHDAPNRCTDFNISAAATVTASCASLLHDAGLFLYVVRFLYRSFSGGRWRRCVLCVSDGRLPGRLARIDMRRKSPQRDGTIDSRGLAEAQSSEFEVKPNRPSVVEGPDQNQCGSDPGRQEPPSGQNPGYR